MNNPQVIAALKRLASAAHELGAVCEREAAEYCLAWHSIGDSAEALAQTGDESELDALVRTISNLLGYRPGSFSEVYIKRSDFDEQLAANATFDQLKARVAAATGELRAELGSASRGSS